MDNSTLEMIKLIAISYIEIGMSISFAIYIHFVYKELTSCFRESEIVTIGDVLNIIFLNGVDITKYLPGGKNVSTVYSFDFNLILSVSVSLFWGVLLLVIMVGFIGYLMTSLYTKLSEKPVFVNKKKLIMKELAK